jgi:hypothetical protein
MDQKTRNSVLFGPSMLACRLIAAPMPGLAGLVGLVGLRGQAVG